MPFAQDLSAKMAFLRRILQRSNGSANQSALILLADRPNITLSKVRLRTESRKIQSLFGLHFCRFFYNGILTLVTMAVGIVGGLAGLRLSAAEGA